MHPLATMVFALSVLWTVVSPKAYETISDLSNICQNPADHDILSDSAWGDRCVCCVKCVLESIWCVLESVW